MIIISFKCHIVTRDVRPLTHVLHLPGTINMDGLKNVNWDEIFSLPKQFWQEDIRETKRFLEEQVTTDLPEVIRQEVEDQLRRIDSM